MDLLQSLNAYKLVAAKIEMLEILWKKQRGIISKANVKLVFRSKFDSREQRTVEDVMIPAGSGAFKDVFVLRQHPLVVKLMWRDKNATTAWPNNGAAEEQARFDAFSPMLLEDMACCYGQLYLRGLMHPSNSFVQGNIL